MAKFSHSYLILVCINFIYACTSICTKMASRQDVLSWSYLLWIASAIGVMGVYALLWQQVISRMPISVAYMLKGTNLVFVLLFSTLFFGEVITLNNLVGSLIIVVGNVLV